MPVLIQARHLLMVTTEVAPLRRKGRMTLAQRLHRRAHKTLGLAERAYRPGELVGLRQDWRECSTGHTVLGHFQKR